MKTLERCSICRRNPLTPAPTRGSESDAYVMCRNCDSPTGKTYKSDEELE